MVARLGGDEFALLQSDVVDPACAGTLAAKIVAEIGKPYALSGQELRTGVSVCIAVWTALPSSPDQLLAQSDQALYRAKDEGRGQYRFYSPEIDEEARARVALGEDLRKALEREQLGTVLATSGRALQRPHNRYGSVDTVEPSTTRIAFARRVSSDR